MAYYAKGAAVLTAFALLKCGQLQSFLKIPHDDSAITIIKAAEKYLTVFMIDCVTG
jgi:hypothetical protein